MKDYMDLVMLLFNANQKLAMILISITFVVIVFLGRRDINNLKDENAKLKEQNQVMKEKYEKFHSNLEKYELQDEETARLITNLRETKSKLKDAEANVEQDTQQWKAIEYFLENLTQLEQEMTDNLKRIKAGKQLFEEQEDWTEEYIKYTKGNSKEKWWQKFSKQCQKLVKSLTQPPSR